jgi:hypothetical protein
MWHCWPAFDIRNTKNTRVENAIVVVDLTLDEIL